VRTVTASAACASHPGLPLVPRARLVPIGTGKPSAPTLVTPRPTLGPGDLTIVAHADSLSPDPRIRIHAKYDGPPPSTVVPAFLVDGRLWCPRRGPTGRYTEVARSIQALDARAISSIELVRGAAAAPYTRRCAAPVDALIRVRTRKSEH
jgi:hypothetical protein